MTDTRAPQVAVLGLGAMGLPMATRLAETLPVRAFDVVPDRIALAEQGGATRAGSAPAAAEGADVVVIGVRNQEQLEASMFGEQGAAAVLRPGAVVVLTSTVGTGAVVAAAARLQESGVDLLDAPVSGGAVRARNGDLLIMAGASDAVLSRAEPVLDRLASTLFVAGPNPGDGQTMKTVNQLLCGIHTAAAAEALALADALGLDLDRVLQVLGQGAAASFMLADRGPRIIEQLRGQAPELRSRLDVISKDMGIVHDLVREAGTVAPVAAAAEQAYLLMMARGYASEDDSITALAGRAGADPR
ncbi:NAD(P)-dependent oxidoreductase [Amnibacterium sp. CER49]|uniref:NAD(P)-dependent oxidoreductase n=1 Tax=Amnibacterium sp. CER49 TaxID=3039161 RepID=UPI00244B7647|nr:NAD(P)-dependent oxidoreductase [Amnibacterium sp. CER49]MDH2443819.1 NAD(P)-dependent oxidoreductase [Amnibacterium sp. CER49]